MLLLTHVIISAAATTAGIILAAVAAVAAFGAAFLQQADALSRLRQELDLIKNPPPPPAPRPGGRASRPMMAALYQEKESPVDALAGKPGMKPLVAAGVLALLGVTLMIRFAAQAATSTGPSPEVVALRAALDSTSARLTALGDSLGKLQAAPGAAPAPAATAAGTGTTVRRTSATRVAQRPAGSEAIPKAPEILPPPPLPQR